jgi:ribosomal protein L3 glutamine methyltransferase
VLSVKQAVQAVAKSLTQAGVAYGHGTTNAFDEAAWLVLWRLGLPLHALDDNAERVLSASEQAALDTLVQNRITSRKPAAYLTGEAWLQGVPFDVDERVIVPRSLIAETLADGTLDAWLSDQTQHVLDLCTGNGSLAVLAALAWPDVTVLATDVSNDALAVAAQNIKRHGLQSRITLKSGDGLAAAPGPFDLILCNPPYVNSQSMANLPAEYRAEPSLALAGGADGLDFIRPLLARVAQHLTPKGVLVLEIGNEKPNFEAAYPLLPVVWLPTSAGDEQVLLLERQALPKES